MIDLSVIIPTLNEERALSGTISRAWETLGEGVQVVVVDGGSVDATAPLARVAGCHVIESDAGRGRQMRAGAEVATGEWLLFLHADTLLPREAGRVIEGFAGRGRERVATFRLRFDSPGRFLSVCAYFTRFDSVWTRFGDQGVLVHRDHYERLGGMPDWPLFEDVEFLRRARRLAPVVSLPAAVVTSARRFERKGAWRQQALNAWLLHRFLRGESPEALAHHYFTHRINPAPRTDETVTR